MTFWRFRSALIFRSRAVHYNLYLLENSLGWTVIRRTISRLFFVYTGLKPPNRGTPLHAYHILLLFPAIGYQERQQSRERQQHHCRAAQQPYIPAQLAGLAYAARLA